MLSTTSCERNVITKSIIIKRSIKQEDKTITNIHTPNSKALKYVKQTLADLRVAIHSNKKIIGDLNNQL